MEEVRAWSMGGCLETSPESWMLLSLDGKMHWILGGYAPTTSVVVQFYITSKTFESCT